MQEMIKQIIGIVMWVWSRIYTYEVSMWLREKRNVLYTLWVSQFMGEVGEHTHFERPLLLQGGGQRRIKIGLHTYFGHHCVLGSWEMYMSSEGVEHYEPEIFIGNHCSIGEYCHITAINKITIGDGLLTGRFVYIGDNAHGGLSLEEANIPPQLRKLTSKGEIRIGRNVWIGDKVSIFGGVTIGDNVIIGAGSIVTHDVPSNCMVAGMPGRIIKSI